MSRDRFPLAAALLDLYAAPYSSRLTRFVVHLEIPRLIRSIPSILD